MIALFAQENQLALSSEAARLLYAGIVGDTGRFSTHQLGARTFRIAAQLEKLILILLDLSRQMDTMSFKD